MFREVERCVHRCVNTSVEMSGPDVLATAR
jgi:hypothetical protein